CDHLAEQVVVVIDGRGGNVDLRGPVRGMPSIRPLHELETLDEVPPAVIVVAVGLRVEAALELRHPDDPASEDEQLPPASPSKSMQNACCTFPARGTRSLRATTLRMSRPIASNVRTVSSSRSASRRWGSRSTPIALGASWKNGSS